jgi:hypothetical protein
MSTLRVNAIIDATGGNTATINTYTPPAPVRAWVNFNGTGTVAIRASFNVTSITDNGTGDYTVNFSTAMPDSNYVINTSAIGGAQAGGVQLVISGCNPGSQNGTTKTTSALQIKTGFVSSSLAQAVAYDHPEINVSIFR